MKWSHRALLRDEFLSEWQARDTAVHLAMEVVYDNEIAALPRTCGFAVNPLVPIAETRDSVLLRRRNKGLHVGVADHLDLLLGSEDELRMYQRSLCADSFACGLTPWSQKHFPDDLVPVDHHNPSVPFGDPGDPRAPMWSFLSSEIDTYCCPMYTIGSMMQCSEGTIVLSNRMSEDSPHVSPMSSTSSQSGDTHRLVPEPPWAPCIWHLLRNDGIVEDEMEGPVVYVTSFFISHHHQLRCDEPRPLRFDVDFRDWNRDVQLVWEDVMDAAAPFDIIPVQPEPPHLAFPGTVATVIIQQHHVPHRVACLTTAVYIADPRTHFSQAAHSTALALDPDDVFRLARTLEVCQQRHQHGFGRCTISIGARALPDDQPVPLHSGLGLTIRVPAQMSDAELETNLVNRIARHRAHRDGDAFDPGEPDHHPEDQHPLPDDANRDPEDAVSFMARRAAAPASPSPSSSSSRSASESSMDPSSSHSSDPPTWLSTVVFSTDGRSLTVNLPWGFQTQMIAVSARAFMLFENEIIRIHRVSSQPHDLVQLGLQCAILQRSDAVRPYASFRLILFDVEVYEDFAIQPAQLRRFARWAPSRMTPRSIMRLLGLEQQCLNPRLRCTVWYNNAIQHLWSSSLLILDDGDYIKVLVRNPQLVCSAPMVDTSDVSFLTQLPSPGFLVNPDIVCPERLTDALVAHDHRPGLQFSFTDAFLQAVRLFQETATDLPDFSDDEDNLDDMPPWIRELYSTWHRLAVVGPGHVERLARLETWFSDHVNLQQSHYTRIAILGSDISHWERQLKLLWRDHLIPDAPLEFHLVDPLPEDAASQVIGQLLLVQRPDRFQRSIIISTYDNWYDRGMAHSQAYVTVDRIDLHSVRWVLNAESDCPPEQAHHVCALFFGSRQMADHERMVARHGHSFRFLIHRRSVDELSNMTDMDDQQLYARLQHLSGQGPLSPQAALVITSPGWIQDLQRAFNEFAFVERIDEGAIAYLQTWHLNGLRATRCQSPRTVRLRSDNTAWQRSITEVWADRLDLRLPLLLIWIQPSPLNAPTQSFVGHLLVLQEMRDDQVALLLTAVESNAAHPDVHHVALCSPTRISANDAIDLFPIPTSLTRAPILVRLDQRILHARRPHAVEHGDNVVLEVTIPAHVSPVAPHGDPAASSRPAAHFDPISHEVSLSSPQQLPAPTSTSADLDNPWFTADEDPDHEVTHLLQTQARPVSLTLQTLLPAPRRTIVDCQRVIFLHNQLRAVDLFQPQYDVQSIWWHDSTWAWLRSLPTWEQEPVLGFTLYVDGSAHRRHDQAAAGVVRLIQTPQGLRWGGFLSALCLGAATAPRAEATAVLLAILWLHQCLALQSGTVWCEIAFDSANTANGAQGLQLSHCNHDLHVLVRSLIHWFEERFGQQIWWTHHYSHTNHPWNEAADTVCRLAQQSRCALVDLQPIMDLCTMHQTDQTSFQWLWLLERSYQGYASAPLLIGHSWHFDVEAPFGTTPDVHLHPAVQRQRDCDVSSRALCSFSLRAATANVLTLFPDQVAPASYLSARAEDLAQQFDARDLHIVGLQETRSRAHGHCLLDPFHVLSAPATAAGQGGVQLWLRRKIQGPDGDIDVDVHDLRILHATSRRLIVRWAHPGIRLIIMVLHAPSDDDEEVLQSFWDATSKALPSSYHTWATLVLVDANSRVGTVTSTAIQAHQADDENLKGAMFHAWLLHHDLFLPQTFDEHHFGPGSTWTHPKGAVARLDFIALSSNLRHPSVRTWVADDVDLVIHRQDHACVCAEVSLSYFSVDKRARDRKLPVRQPELPPQISWQVDVHTHAARLQQWLHSHQTLRKQWRKAHLTDKTKQLIDLKRAHWKRICAVQRCFRKGLLRQLFDSWRQPQRPVENVASWIRSCDVTIAWHRHSYQCLLPTVVKAVRGDDKSFYEQLAYSAGVESMKGCHAMWAALRPILPRWRCKRTSNLRCTGPSIEAQFDHYDQLEAGELVDYPDLVRRCHAHQQCASFDLPLMVKLSDLPSRCDVEAVGAKLKINKAAGIDSVRPDTVRRACAQSSDLLHQLFLKVWLLGSEPIQYKGGLLHAIAKKDGGHRIDQMRGIMLIDVVGKLLHALLRQCMMTAMMPSRQPLQLGGFARKSTLFATQYLRAFAQRAAEQHLSSAVLFLDIRSAFHSLIRAFVFQLEEPLPDRLVTVLQQAGCDLEALRHQLDHQVSPLDHGISASAAHLLADAHSHTWYTLGPSAFVHQTARGSRPGSPLADAAYNALMSMLIADLQQALDSHPPLQRAFLQLGLTAPLVAWVDDLALPLVSESASGLVEILQWTMRTTQSICGSFGLQLNLKPKKTETVLAFRGSGAPACRKRWLIEAQGHIPLAPSADPLRCAVHYEHLGTIFQSDGGLAAEIRHRVHKASLAFRQVQRPIFRNRHIPVPVRLRLLDHLVLPVLLHGAGNWGVLTTSQLGKLHAVYLKWIRGIVGNGFWAVDQQTDHHLLLCWQLPTISMKLAKARLLFAFHWSLEAPPALVDFVTAMATHSTSWFLALRHAIKFFQELDATFYDGCPLTDTLEILCAWLRDHVQDGPRLVRRLFRQALRHAHVIGRAVSHHCDLQRALRRGGVVFIDPPPEPALSPPDVDIEYPGDLPPRLPALRVPHVPTQTEVLLDTRDHALQHWQVAWHQEHLPEVLDETERIRFFGAFDAVLSLHGHHDPVDIEAVLLEITMAADDESAVQPLVPAPPLGHWALGLWFLDHLCFSRFDHYEAATFGRVYDALRSLVLQSPIGRLVCWRRRMDEAFNPRIAEVADDVLAGDHLELASLRHPVQLQNMLLAPLFTGRLLIPDCLKVPICVEKGKKVMWILHLFSGRRRKGDCHWWLSHIGHHLSPDIEVRLLSLDTAVHSTLGDLSAGANFRLVRDLAHRGAFAACLTGPPCETFSAARHIELDDFVGPRPLRSAELPWGLPGRSSRELRQLDMGTELLLNSQQIEVATVLAGGGSLMEHPWENDDPSKASVWRTLAQTQWIMSLPGAFRHFVEQWKFGSPGIKPTCLRALNLGPEQIVQRALQDGMELWRARPQTQLKGRTSAGVFRTAAAKEYSSALCRSLVVATLRGLRSRIEAHGTIESVQLSSTESQWIVDAWNASHQVTRQSFLPDYQGH
eukprot:s2455_g2.t1